MADQTPESERITVDAHEWSILRRGAAPEVEQVIDRLVAFAKAEALREAAEAYGPAQISGFFTGPSDYTKAWLRERAERLYRPEGEPQ